MYVRLNKENDIEIGSWSQMNPGLESCGAAILNGGPERFQGTSMQGKYRYKAYINSYMYKFSINISNLTCACYRTHIYIHKIF